MNVPMEVIKKGKIDEYVELKEQESEFYRKMFLLASEYEETIEKIYKHITHKCYYEEKCISLSSIGSDKVWSHALVMEGLSKQLLEIAGEFSQTRSSYLESKE